MTDLPDSLYNPSQNPAKLAADLLHHYSFELAGYPLMQQVEIWLEYYPATWLPLALIEALYQGRYKAISVEQILNLWERRQHPVYHFNHEFERLICGNLPQPVNGVPEGVQRSAALLANPSLSYRKMLLELPSVQAASRLERLSEIPALKLALNRSEVSGANSLAVDPVVLPELPAGPFPSLPAEAKTAPGSQVSVGGTVNRDREFQGFKEGVVFGLSSGLAVPLLKPHLRLVLSQLYRPNWMAFLEEPTAIAPFVPEPTVGDRDPLKT